MEVVKCKCGGEPKIRENFWKTMSGKTITVIKIQCRYHLSSSVEVRHNNSRILREVAIVAWNAIQVEEAIATINAIQEEEAIAKINAIQEADDGSC